MENKAVTIALIVASFIAGVGGTIIVDKFFEGRAKAKREQQVQRFLERISGHGE